MEVRNNPADELVISTRDNNCSNHQGTGWGAVGGALIGGGFGAAAVSIWDKINDTRSQIESVKTNVQEAKAGIYKDIQDSANGTNQRVDGVAREVLNNRSVTERATCELGHHITDSVRNNQDYISEKIQNLKDIETGNRNDIMDRLCNMEHQQDKCCCENKQLIAEVEHRLSLQAERNHCEVMAGQKEIKCLIENTAKDQEIARLNRIVDAQRDQNIINQVVSQLKTTTTTTTA